MVNLLGKQVNRSDLLKKFGDYSVLVGTRKYTLHDGKSDRVKITEVHSGSGLRFEINESRGMDIGNCYYKEIPIAYRSYCEESHPMYYEAYHNEWLRSFSGGLLINGGLVSMGSSEVGENGEKIPLHGRISNIPASNVFVKESWEDEQLYIDIKGSVREAKTLEYNLVLDRHIRVKAGESSFVIYDKVTNQGFQDVEHMMLYHFNIGYPILDRDSKFYAASNSILPRDDIASSRDEPYNTYLGPTPNYPDTVYYHDIKQKDGYCCAAIINHKRNLGFAIKYNKETLDQFVQWKFTGEGNYVAGLEPCNARVNGKSIERDEKRLKVIKAQESISYEVHVQIIDGEENIKKYLEENKT